jgi:hypothetical protein
MMKKYILILLFIAFSLNSFAQFWSIGIKISGIGYHQQYDKNAQLYRWKLSKDGKLTAFASFSITASYNFNRFIGIKVFQTFSPFDCGGKFTGISHIGINLQDDIIDMKMQKHHLSASIGPFWYYRKNWATIDGYKRDPNFVKLSKNKKWEYLFVWHGGQIQYDYLYKPKRAFSMNLLPGYPYFYTAAFGSSFRF